MIRCQLNHRARSAGGFFVGPTGRDAVGRRAGGRRAAGRGAVGRSAR